MYNMTGMDEIGMVMGMGLSSGTAIAAVYHQ
jgi:uncharacterized protein YoaH (UPF0181 family)